MKKSRNPNLMKSSIFGRLKNLKTDTGGATKGTSPSPKQPNEGEEEPRIAERPAPRHGQLWSRVLEKTNRKQPIW